MYKHIVVPVEIGEAKTYEDAVRAASTLLAEGGKVTLLHVIEPVPTYVSTYIPPDISVKSKEVVKEQLQEMAKGLDIANTALIFGSAGRGIVDWTTENDADCIVVKSHKPEFTDLFLGSTAAWVVRHAPTSVHVMR